MRTAGWRPAVGRRGVLVLLAVVAVVAPGCLVNQGDLAAIDRLLPGEGAVGTDVVRGVAYGPDPAQLLDVHLPPGDPVGTIVWLHGGGWTSGDRSSVSPLVLSFVPRGWAVVSADYRLAPAARAADQVADVDRLVRFVRAEATALGLDTSPLLVAGGSAGGHLALMAAAAPGLSVAPDLPPALAAESPEVDGVLAMAAPTDLRTVWQGPWVAQSSVEDLLGCTPSPETSDRDLPECTPAALLQWSPLTWVWLADLFGQPLPPAYLAYGALDELVPLDTQGMPLAEAWSENGRWLDTWLDVPPSEGHNVDVGANRTALELWLGTVLDREPDREQMYPSTVPAGDSPVGWLDAVTTGPGSVTVAGWAIDPGTAASIAVRVVVDGTTVVPVPADRPRPDVAAVYPRYGPDHGFEATFAVDPGPRRVCVHAVDVAPGTDVLLGCRDVEVPPGPVTTTTTSTVPTSTSTTSTSTTAPAPTTSSTTGVTLPPG